MKLSKRLRKRTPVIIVLLELPAQSLSIPQLAERLKCFKSLKPGPRAKTQDAAPAKKQGAGSSKVKDAARAKQAAPAKSEQTAPAKTEQPAPEQTAPAKTEQAAPEQTAPAKTGQDAPANTDKAAPAITERQPSNTGDFFSPTPDDPATTSSINRLSVAGEPLCVDAEALAAMVLSRLLTSDPTKAATDGCQTLPGDAKLELLERYPSVFPFIRIVRVRVTSPTQPDLTFGFTIETGR